MIIRSDNYDLTRHNTFGLKVSCASFLEYDTLKDLSEIDFKSLPQPIFHIGAGSNLLFTQDFPGTVMHSAIRYIGEPMRDGYEVIVEVGAGTQFDEFVAWSCEKGFWGAENLSAIPGETGAAAVQNIGAYGVEAKDIIERVDCFDTTTGTLVSFGANECDYGYRESMFKRTENKGRYIVTGVTFRLGTIPMPKLDYGGVRAALDGIINITPKAVRLSVSEIRSSKLPDPTIIGSAGSFFKNPVLHEDQYRSICKQYGEVPHYITESGVKIPAAWMIEKCGFKGAVNGGAAVFEKQPLVITNHYGTATAADILELEKRIIEGVRERFGVELHPEVEHL